MSKKNQQSDSTRPLIRKDSTSASEKHQPSAPAKPGQPSDLELVPELLGRVKRPESLELLQEIRSHLPPPEYVEFVGTGRRRYKLEALWNEANFVMASKWREYLNAENEGERSEILLFLTTAEKLLVEKYLNYQERRVTVLKNLLQGGTWENEEIAEQIRLDESYIKKVRTADTIEDAFKSIQYSIFGFVTSFYRGKFEFDKFSRDKIKEGPSKNRPLPKNLSSTPEKGDSVADRNAVIEAIALALDLTKLRTEKVIRGIKVGDIALEIRMVETAEQTSAKELQQALKEELEALVASKTPPGGEYYNQRKDRTEDAGKFLKRVYGRYLEADVLFKHQLRAMDQKLVWSLRKLSSKRSNDPGKLAEIPAVPTKKEETDNRIKKVSNIDPSMGRVLSSLYRREK